MSLNMLNSTATYVYMPVTDDGSDDEDEDEQVEGCAENLRMGTSICSIITRIKEDGIHVNGGVTPDVEPERFRRHRVHCAAFAVVGSPTVPPRGPVPRSATIFRRRGTRHGIHCTMRVRLDMSSTRFVRVWAAAQNDRGQVLTAATFLFELRSRPRGAGLESFRLIERDASIAERPLWARRTGGHAATTVAHESGLA